MPRTAEPAASTTSVADLAAQGKAVEALTAVASAETAAALQTLRSPRLRGPFPYPDADDLGRSSYLRALARWGRAAALRSKRTLGARGLERALEAARRLMVAAELLAAVEGADGHEAAQAAAAAALERLDAAGAASPKP